MPKCIPSPAWGLQAIGSFKSFRTMAKSKVGGTRAYIRGRIGSDVYSVGKTAKGDRQQVVRSLAEQVSNPRTEDQMRGRMIMSTVMQVVSALSPIIDHSFDGFPNGQPSISQFIKENYGKIKADVAAHPSSGGVFGINKYQVKGALPGKYLVSQGTAVLPACVDTSVGLMDIMLTATTLTVGGLRAALGLAAEGYLTMINMDNVAGVDFVRVHVKDSLPDNTVIDNASVATLFDVEGNVTPTITLSTNTIRITVLASGNLYQSYGVIVSDKVDGAWIHNTCTLDGDFSAMPDTADQALPTYPTGSVAFLNGGEI